MFGNEEAVMEIKRSSLDCVNYFKMTFSKENNYFHNKRIHIIKWTEYFDLDAGAKK